MNFCCGVTLFYPTSKELENVLKYKEIFEKVYIYDNTDKGEELSRNKKIIDKHLKDVVYISNAENNGLAIAYNKMCEIAIFEKFDYICLFDQDSIVDPINFKKMIHYVNENGRSNVGVYAPNIIFKHEKNNSLLQQSSNNELEVEWAISSGSFINLKVFSLTCGFDEEYFIDRIDYDYCLGIKEMNYSVIMLKDYYLLQTLGQLRTGLFSKVSQHGPIRHYYVFRNRLYFYCRKKRDMKVNVLWLSFQHILKILLLENKKFEKILMVGKAWKDYRKGVMGKLID